MNIKPTIVLAALLGAALPVAFVACSIGEGVSSTCDPNAAPNDPNACSQVASCDNGNGRVIPEDDCCRQAGNHEYNVCNGADITVDDAAADFRDLCVPGGATPPSGCCNPAQSTFDLCMAGVLNGSAGAGGATGAGGNGMGGAGGDGMGGNGTGGNGTGGAGGNGTGGAGGN